MSPRNQTDNTPLYFRVTKDYVIGTPGGIDRSDRTLDMPFNELAENYDLQEKLNLSSRVFIKPFVQCATPRTGMELCERVASYISSFTEDSIDGKQERDYLVNNGTIRILIIDDALRNEFRKLYACACIDSRNVSIEPADSVLPYSSIKVEN